MTYTPRPGSKTEAAINFIRARGGWARHTEICHNCDIDRRNLPSILKSAVINGAIANVERNNICGYALADSVSIAEYTAKTMQNAKTKAHLAVPGVPEQPISGVQTLDTGITCTNASNSFGAPMESPDVPVFIAKRTAEPSPAVGGYAKALADLRHKRALIDKAIQGMEALMELAA